MLHPAFYVTLLILTISTTTAALAADVDLPSAADPGRNRTIQAPNPADLDITPRQTLQSDAPDLPDELAKQSFMLKSLQLDGMTAFDTSEIAQIYADDLNKTISVARLFTILAAIQQRYFDAGYTLSRVLLPEQDLTGGNIRFQVIEGHVARLDIAPELGNSAQIQDFRAQVLAMRPLNTRKLEQLMLQLNDLPSGATSAVLGALEGAKPDSGAIVMTIIPRDVDTDRGYLSIDNYGSNYTGSGQIHGGYSFDHLVFRHSRLQVDAGVTTSLSEMKQLSASYTVPLFGLSGLELQLRGDINNTAPGSDLDELDIAGKSRGLGASLSYDLIRQRDQNWDIRLSFDYKNVATDILQEDLFDDRIRKLALGSSYSFYDGLAGINIMQGTFSKGLDIMGSRETGSTDLSRADGISDFSKWEFGYTRLQTLPASFDLLFTTTAQYTDDPLLSSEEFGFGGANMGRGYDPSELTGDLGFGSAVELRRAYTLSDHGLQLQPYIFYDFGKVWNIDPSEKSHDSAASAGIGMRAVTANGWKGDLTLADPLTRSSDNPPKYSDPDDLRVLLSVKKSF